MSREWPWSTLPSRAAVRGRWALLAAIAALLAPSAPLSAEPLVGREFWFAWPRTADVRPDDPSYDIDAELLLVAADGPLVVRVDGPGVARTVDVAPGAPTSVRLLRAVAMVTDEDVASPRALHLTTDGCGLFGAIFRVPGSGASVGDDACRLIPAELAGTRYLPLAYWGGSEFVVVANGGDTTVTIADPSCASPAPVLLRRGDALLHRCVNAPGDGDVTGTIVTASAPVSVISGSEASTIINHQGSRPDSRGYWGYGDVLLESAWPADLLGRDHAHAPFRKGSADASGDLVRIVAACDGTRVTLAEPQGARSVFLARAGDHLDVESSDAAAQRIRLVPGAIRITSDRGVGVATYTVGNINAGVGDPSMSALDPVERWERGAIAVLPAGYEHSLAVVTSSSATAGVRVDGAAPASAWAPVGSGDGLSWTRLDLVPAGEHRVTGDAPLFVEVSGVLPAAGAGAYSYPAIAWDPGSGLAPLHVLGGDTCATSCPGDCRLLRGPAGFATYAWSGSAATGVQTTACPSVTTTVTLTATDSRGCVGEGSVILSVLGAPDAPTISGPDEACVGACMTLTAPAGYDSYSWTSGEMTQAITACPVADTTYEVTVSSASGCGGVARHSVVVHPAPVASDAIASRPGGCVRGIDVTWLEAQWRPGSPGGVYNVYRRDGACAAVDDASWGLVAVGLPGPPWRDRLAGVGVVHAYMIEAEDAPAGAACRPGPARGGSTDRRCARPAAGIADTGDPDAPRLVGLSPWLRATGYETASRGGSCTTVTFAWSGAPPADPVTHVEAWRSDDASSLVAYDRGVTGTSWRDGAPGSSWLLFYQVFNVTACGSRGD